MTEAQEKMFYRECRLCPRNCGTDRASGARGVCGESSAVRMACAVLHKGEEPPVSGETGSAAFFFTGCTLGCCFCQNGQISRGGYGGELSVEELASIMTGVQGRAATVNLVTGTHFAPSLVRTVELYRGEVKSASPGARPLPVVWNGSGYENPGALDLLAPAVDIHLPDLKTLSGEHARRWFRAPGYPAAAAAAIRTMAATHPLVYEGETLVRGVIMRHLVMPGAFEETARVLRWFADNIAGSALLSLMVQYVDTEHPGSSSSITEREYDALLDLLDDLGIDEGFIQETGDEIPWIPDFTRENPFPDSFSVPVWHCPV